VSDLGEAKPDPRRADVEHPGPAALDASDASPPDATEDARAHLDADAEKWAVQAPGGRASDGEMRLKNLVRPLALCKLGAALFAER